MELKKLSYDSTTGDLKIKTDSGEFNFTGIETAEFVGPNDTNLLGPTPIDDEVEEPTGQEIFDTALNNL